MGEKPSPKKSGPRKRGVEFKVSKGFLQSEVLGEVSVLEGGEVFREVCGKVFGLVLLGHSESPKFPWLCTAKLEKFQGRTSWRGSARGPSPSLRGVAAMRCYSEPPKPSKPPKPSWRLLPLNSTPLCRHPEKKKPPTPINPTEKSLGKQFAQTASACRLFNSWGKRENTLHEQLRKLFTQTLLVGVGGLGGGFPSLE